MATKPVKRSNAPKLANLHDDFKTWWSGVHWIWNPKKYEEAKPVRKICSPNKGNTMLLLGASAAVGTGEPHAEISSQLRISNSVIVSLLPQTDFVEAGVKELPLYSVTPYFEIRRSPKGGYGAFALQDIAPYTEIFSEKPLLQAGDWNLLERFEKLSDEDKEVYMKLASYDRLDTNKVVAIFKTNRFRTDGGNCGIFSIATRFNHACMPLCKYQYKGETEELVLTTRSATIRKGQEITISYGQTGDELLENWGFICDCDICAVSEW